MRKQSEKELDTPSVSNSIIHSHISTFKCTKFVSKKVLDSLFNHHFFYFNFNSGIELAASIFLLSTIFA